MSIASTTAMPTEMPEIRGGVQTSLVSRPPSTLQEEKGSGEYSTTFFVPPQEFLWHNLIG